MDIRGREKEREREREREREIVDERMRGGSRSERIGGCILTNRGKRHQK